MNSRSDRAVSPLIAAAAAAAVAVVAVVVVTASPPLINQPRRHGWRRRPD